MEGMSGILKYSSILLLGLLLQWWIIFYSPLNLPERIPTTPIKVDGLLLVVLLLTILIIAEKRFLKVNPDSTIFKLMVYGTTICFLAEIVFQAIRQPFLNAESFSDRFYYFLLGTIGITAYSAAFSFFIAFQLKRKKTGQLILLIIGFVAIINIIKYLFPTLTGQ